MVTGVFRIRWYFFIPVLILAGCFGDNDCSSTSTNQLQIRFFDIDSLTEESRVFSEVKVSGTDTVFYDNFDTLSVFQLPVDPSTTTTTFLFGSDSLVVGYEVAPRLISEDCGPELIYSDLQAMSHSFDSVMISQDFNRDAETNIKIFD